MSYLAHLVAEQNFYRSKSVSFEDWIKRRSKSGVLNIQFASKLIKSLKTENAILKKEFGVLKEKNGIGTFRGEIHVSDLRSFQFCERAAYYSSHQFPSQNLIDLRTGKKIHRRYSDSENRDPSKQANVSAYLRRQEPTITQVVWFPDSPDATLRHHSRAFVGRPDGFVHYADGSVAVIELKSVEKLPQIARSADFDQADAYALIASEMAQIRDESFVLYIKRSTRELALHRRKRTLTEYDLARILAKIERGARDIEVLSRAASEAQCASCGYRSVCSGR